MRCQYCGGELLENAQFCGGCGNKIYNNNHQNSPMTNSDNLIMPSVMSYIEMNDGKQKDSDEKIFFIFQMWFIHIVFCVTILIFGIPAIVLLIIRLIKYPNRRKGALIGVAGFVGGWIIFAMICDFIYGADDRAVKKLINAGQYEEALEYVENHYASTQKSYYFRKADIYDKQGNDDMAAQSILRYTEIVADLTKIDDNTLSRLKKYKGRVSDDINIELDSRIEEISIAISEKTALEKQLDDEKMARESAEKQLAREKAVNETTQKKLTDERQAKEAAEQQLADEKATRETVEQQLADEKATREVAEKELAEKKDSLIIQTPTATPTATPTHRPEPTATPIIQQDVTGNTVTSGDDLIKFIRDTNNIGSVVTFRGKVSIMIRGERYSILLKDKKQTLVNVMGWDDNMIVLSDDEVEVTGVYMGTNANGYGIPCFEMISITVL